MVYQHQDILVHSEHFFVLEKYYFLHLLMLQIQIIHSMLLLIAALITIYRIKLSVLICVSDSKVEQLNVDLLLSVVKMAEEAQELVDQWFLSYPMKKQL